MATEYDELCCAQYPRVAMVGSAEVKNLLMTDGSGRYVRLGVGCHDHSFWTMYPHVRCMSYYVTIVC